MVNDTCNNDPAPEQQSKHQQASTVNHVTKELHDTDALKKKNIKRYFTVITSATFQRKQTKRLR